MRKLLSPFKKEKTIVHRVSDGESVYRIALRYSVSPKRIIEANGLTCEPRKNALLFVERGENRLYVVRPSDTPERISLKTGVPAAVLLSLNGADSFYPFSLIEVPKKV